MLKITKEFKKYKIPKENLKMKDFCFPKKFKHQPQQLLLADVLDSKLSPWNDDDKRGVLVFHQIGAGKTCTAINVAERFKNRLDVVVVLPAALIGNFKGELYSSCSFEEYLTDKERQELKGYSPNDAKYKKLIDKANKKIDKYYTIYSYHKFVALIEEGKIKKLNNTLLIIDEVQNMVSMTGTFYRALSNIVNASDETLKMLLLSATPMFDRPIEIALTINLLKRDNKFEIRDFNTKYMNSIETNKGIFYKTKNMNNFANKISKLVSYYRGAPPIAYPEKRFKIVRAKMSDFQYKSYLTSLSADGTFKKGSFKNVDLLELPPNFFLGPRMVSNIAFPNKSIGDNGFGSFRGDKLLMTEIKNYSIKFYKIIKKINQSTGPTFVYSNFLEYGGIKPFITFLKAHGWKNYRDYGEGKKRFCLWSGDEKQEVKEEIKYVFNKKENKNGELIKIMIGSPSIKEGVSLLRIEQIHIMEPYWNMSRLLQIMGRGLRFCSHKDMPSNRRFVDIFLYLATDPNKEDTTIDEYVWELANKKDALIGEFENALKENAFDCELFINRNSYKSDEKKLVCNV